MRRLNIFLATSLVLAVALGAAPAWAKPQQSDEARERDQLYERLNVLAEVIDQVRRNYVEPPAADDLVHGAIEGILARLDPHSSFMNKDMFHEMRVDTEGEFGGLGIEVTYRDKALIVVSPIEDTPAFEAGIKAGDVIVAIDGEPTRELDLAEAVKTMRGQVGSKVTIKIVREGEGEPLEFTIIRDLIKVRSVKKLRIDGVGVVRIAQFKKNTGEEVRKALGELTSDDGVEGIVLDLRNNPGGLLDQAVEVADLFLEKGPIVSTRGRNITQEVVFTARDDGDETSLPLVVLVNRGSASASEIVAGALQDHKRAAIIGERTFGKGSVQSVLPLSDGSGIRLTTALYYTPSDRSIQAKGIIPDIYVRSGIVRKEEDTEAEKMHRTIREEDLKGHFETNGPEGTGTDAKKILELDNVRDAQLKRAVEVIRSWELLKRLEAPLEGG